MGSLMQEHPRFAELVSKVRIHRIHIRMFDFGGESEKGTWLYSAHAFLGKLKDCATGASSCSKRKLTISRLDSNGVKVTDGIKGALKQSQHYPIQFGRALAALYHDHIDEVRANACAITSAARGFAVQELCTSDLWEDAQLDAVLTTLA